MIVRMGLLQKKQDLSPSQFRAYWRERHGPVAEALPGLRRYEQNHVVEAEQRGIHHKRGPRDYDGFSQLWFDNIDAMVVAVESQSRSLALDERAFIADLDLVVAEPTEVLPPPTRRPAVKRMSTLKRRADLSPEGFSREWLRHAELVTELPGLLGYIQHRVISRSKNKDSKSGAPNAAYAELPIDGIVELWFEDLRSVDRAFTSSQGLKTMAHAGNFIDEINAYMVEPVQIR